MTVFEVHQYNMSTAHDEMVFSTEFASNPEWVDANHALAEQRADAEQASDSETDHTYYVREVEK